ncbi:MAG: alkaline phosphatase family protein, partial [bacterium]|nr:alkaline phosphatase family protein [bacterium]
MGLLNIFKKKKRIAVIGLDGVPFTFLNRIMEEGRMPFLKKLISSGGHFQRMNSVIPTISSVAWSTYMTGKDCSGHGIYGFIDRTPNPFKLYIPMAKHMKAETLWEYLSGKGKRVFVMNVPETYPPRKVNGILISCFLATDINKATYPAEVSEELK